MNKFLKDERGDTNLVSLLILLAVIVVAALIFRPYIAQLFDWFIGLFKK